MEHIRNNTANKADMYFFISFLTSFVLLKPRDIYIHGNRHF